MNHSSLFQLWSNHRAELDARVQDFALRGGTAFHFEQRGYLMGVINLSPDSWYRESVCHSAAQAIERGRVLHLQGASIVDLGAESSLPQAQRVSAAEQVAQLVPIVEGLAAHRVPVSVETYHAEVAEACLQQGAEVINLTGLSEADEIYRLAARHQAAVIVCFVAGENVRSVGAVPLDVDWVAMQREYFQTQIDRATSFGVSRLWLDPGLGFYYPNLMDSQRRVAYQVNAFLQSFRLRTLGWPVCHALPHAVAHFREEVRSAETMFAVLARLGKTDLLRTHEVSRVRPVLDTLGTA